MSSAFSLPFTVRSTILYETGLEHIILLLSAPIDDITSYFTFVIWRNDDFSVPEDEVVAFDRAIGAEDKLMLEMLDGRLASRQNRCRQRSVRQAVSGVAPPVLRVDQRRGRPTRLVHKLSTSCPQLQVSRAVQMSEAWRSEVSPMRMTIQAVATNMTTADALRPMASAK